MNANLESMCGGRYYGSKGDRFETGYGYEYNYGLGGTPLDESLMIIRDYIADFKHNYGIDKLQFVTLTDGDSFSIDAMRYGTKQFFHDRRTKGTYVYKEDSRGYRGGTDNLLNGLRRLLVLTLLDSSFAKTLTESLTMHLTNSVVSIKTGMQNKMHTKFSEKMVGSQFQLLKRVDTKSSTF